MSESMKDYEAEINASFRKIGVGDIVTGTVIAVTEEDVTVDLRYFAPGIIKSEDYSDDPDCMLKEAVQIGDTVEATVIRTDDGEGTLHHRRQCVGHSTVAAGCTCRHSPIAQPLFCPSAPRSSLCGTHLRGERR